MRPTKAERAMQAALKAAQPPAEPKATPGKTEPAPRRPLAPVPIEPWFDCYDESWRGYITPESFAHPAKAGRALLGRIFSDLFARGALTAGSIVVDPFGGIGTTGIIGAYRKCRCIGHELEPKFVALARENIDMHRKNWEALNCPIPVMIQGDSRKLRANLTAADAVVSSPPYAEGLGHGGTPTAIDREKKLDGFLERYGDEHGQLGRLSEGDVDAVVSSPPYSAIASGAGGLNTQPGDAGQQSGRRADTPSQDTDQRYGDADGQLAKLPEGQIDAIVSSPPYAETILSGGGGIAHEMRHTYRDGQNYGDEPAQLGAMRDDSVDAVISSPPYESAISERGGRSYTDTEPRINPATGKPFPQEADQKPYGESPKNLGNMETEGVDAVVSSPPFGTGDSASAQSISTRTDKSAEWVKANCGSAATEGYGTDPGQMAQMSMKTEQDTFWTAARDIVKECHAILKPGGYAVWIVKAFVRDKQIVDFPGDWRRLCEWCGFETITEVHAMLVKTGAFHGRDNIFNEGIIEEKTERKSFFRRLAESKGSPKIDHEVVYIMRKPS